MTILTPRVSAILPTFVEATVTKNCSNAALTSVAMRHAYVLYKSPVTACATAEYRILCAAMSSSAFLDALLFVPLFLQYEYAVHTTPVLLEECKEMCFNLYRSVGICATMAGTSIFPRFFEEFKTSLELLIGFLMKGDDLTREEVMSCLAQGLPCAM